MLKTYNNILVHKNIPVDTAVFQLTTDTAINRLIVGALNKTVKQKKYTGSSLNFKDYFKDVVNPVVKNAHVALTKIEFNSNTERFREVLNYAALIIDNVDYSNIGSDTSVQSFILNFDALFEDFIIKILTEKSSGFSTWGAKKEFARSNTTNYITYKPDILFGYLDEDPNNNFKNSAYAVLDCKNKAYSIFKNADVYQMISYSRKLNAKKSILLYPSFNDKNNNVLTLDFELFIPDVIYVSMAM